MLIVDAQNATVNVDTTARLIQLANADLQSRDVIHPSERAVLTAIAGEDDRVAAFNPCDRAITELDGAIDLGVKLGEELLGAGHVVHRVRVEDPFAADVLLLLS
jgi:hypothetical protein